MNKRNFTLIEILIIVLLFTAILGMSVSCSNMSNTLSDEAIIKSITKDIMEIKDDINEAIDEYEEEK